MSKQLSADLLEELYQYASLVLQPDEADSDQDLLALKIKDDKFLDDVNTILSKYYEYFEIALHVNNFVYYRVLPLKDNDDNTEFLRGYN